MVFVCFFQGVMAESINWDLLQTQFTSQPLYTEVRKMARIIDRLEHVCAIGKWTVTQTSFHNWTDPVQLWKEGWVTVREHFLQIVKNTF